MDPGRFDTLVRSLVTTPTRRGLLRLLAGTTLGGALALPGAGGLADHGCRHPGADCARDGQCCSGRCSGQGTCLCTRAAQCPEPEVPCQKAVCTKTGRCGSENRRADLRCTGCCAGGACEGGDSDVACGRGGEACIACGANARCVGGACAPEGWELVFRDEFDGDALDRSRWATGYPWGRSRKACCGELQWYSNNDANYVVENGRLRIVARRERVEGEGEVHRYTSGLIQTKGSFEQEHGYFEIRARVPAGRGLWPAFWLLPEDGSEPWEIDVVEILGHEPSTVHMTVHYANEEGEPRKAKGVFGPPDSPDFSEGYHTFAVEWGPERLVWYVDGAERHRVEEAQKIPSGPFYLIANLAVGGAWPGAPGKRTVFPASFDIDHVRVYRRPVAPEGRNGS